MLPHESKQRRLDTIALVATISIFVIALTAALRLGPQLRRIPHAGLIFEFIAAGVAPLSAILLFRPTWFSDYIKKKSVITDVLVGFVCSIPFLAAHYYLVGTLVKWPIISAVFISPSLVSVLLALTYVFVYGPLEVTYVIYLAETSKTVTGTRIFFYLTPIVFWVLPHALTGSNAVTAILSTSLDLAVILILYQQRRSLWSPFVFWSLVNFCGW